MNDFNTEILRARTLSAILQDKVWLCRKSRAAPPCDSCQKAQANAFLFAELDKIQATTECDLAKAAPNACTCCFEKEAYARSAGSLLIIRLQLLKCVNTGLVAPPPPTQPKMFIPWLENLFPTTAQCSCSTQPQSCLPLAEWEVADSSAKALDPIQKYIQNLVTIRNKCPAVASSDVYNAPGGSPYDMITSWLSVYTGHQVLSAYADSVRSHCPNPAELSTNYFNSGLGCCSLVEKP